MSGQPQKKLFTHAEMGTCKNKMTGKEEMLEEAALQTGKRHCGQFYSTKY